VFNAIAVPGYLLAGPPPVTPGSHLVEKPGQFEPKSTVLESVDDVVCQDAADRPAIDINHHDRR
jgi:hypothetical protein